MTNCATPEAVLEAMLKDNPDYTPESDAVLYVPDDKQNILFKGTLTECVNQIFTARHEDVMIATLEDYLKRL